jgi:FixJ family two-component response regulator
MINQNPIVFVVDDDPSVRDALSNLLDSVGLWAQTFGSSEEFLGFTRPEVPSCLILDAKLPGMSGPEFQDELRRKGIQIPIIFITAHGDVPMTRRVMKAGAIEFLTKPFQKSELLGAIRQAVDADRDRREEQEVLSVLLGRYQKLTPREREVLGLVTAGLMNKEIAAKLGLSEITVKIHRRQVMTKMEASSFADLVRMADKLKTQSSS